MTSANSKRLAQCVDGDTGPRSSALSLDNSRSAGSKSFLSPCNCDNTWSIGLASSCATRGA
eukprot:CAMPEP_0198511672 /NCGR_PEP_ID=MMETSP1462-20131121/14957_1 /TAXON_ID=1333877 /ORGANISM="Brandtodinium nutriculum, Strain RCC3387" /LENGTH=60 /DNA_ID=CAMNT_0044241045 /DNA_START=81 /DNA_END=260 /DNA_ORIENTATION=+